MNRVILKLKNKKQKSTSIKIIAFVGMSGSGKSSAVDFLKQKNIPQVYFGGVVLHALEEAKAEIRK